MDRKISDLSIEELENIWNKSHKLQEKIFDDCMEFATFEVDNCLYKFSGSYQIGSYCQGEHLEISENISELNEYYNYHDGEWFIEDIKPYFDKYTTLLEKLECDYNLSDENYCRIEKRKDELKNIINDILYKDFIDIYDYYMDKEHCFEYMSEFIDTYDNFYVWEDNTLYEHIDFCREYSL